MRLFKGERRSCPHCGAELADVDDPDRPGRTVKPERGGVVICYGCARPAVFAGVYRPENRVEFLRNMRSGRYVMARAETMFRDDVEFAQLWADLEALMVSP